MKDQDKLNSDETSQQAQQLIDEALTELAKEQATQKKSRSGLWFGAILAFSVVAFATFWWVVRPHLFPASVEATVVEAQAVKIEESKILYLKEGELKAIQKVLNFQYSYGNTAVKIQATIPRIVEFYVSQRLPEAHLDDIIPIHDEQNPLALYVVFNYKSGTSAPFNKYDIPNLGLNMLSGVASRHSFIWRINALPEAIGEEINISAYNDYAKNSLNYYEKSVLDLLGTP